MTNAKAGLDGWMDVDLPAGNNANPKATVGQGMVAFTGNSQRGL